MVDTTAYRQTVDVALRTFTRFEGDGLPNPPAYGPLPVGDPKSGLHTIERDDLREVLGALPDMVDEAAAARDEAVAARDLAQDYAEAAVGASNVPIYATRAFVTTFAVPAGIKTFETNGYATAGDGGGGKYTEDPAPGPGGITDDTPGTPRKFRLISDQVALAMFGGNASDLNAYVNAKLAVSRKVYSPALHFARGLCIKEFLTKGGAWDAQTAPLQEAVNALASDIRYTSLNLEGRHILVEDTIHIDHALMGAGASHYPNVIRNGTITASSGAWAARDQPIIHLFHSGGNAIQDWNFEDVNFRGGLSDAGYTSGVFIDGGSLSIRFRRCQFRNMAMYGIKSRQNEGQTGQNLRVEFCEIIACHPASMPFADRTCVALDLWQDGDGKIIGNRILLCRHALVGSIGSYLVNFNHFFQGRGGQSTPQGGYNPGIIVGARCNTHFVNNYIDNGHVQFDEGLRGENLALGQGFATFTGNRFTMADSAATESFMLFRPLTGGINLSHLIITNNEFRVIGNNTGRMVEPFKVGAVRGGWAATANSMNVKVYDNYFWGDIQPQTTYPEVRLTTNTSSVEYPVNVTGRTAFGLQANVPDRVGSALAGDPASIWYERDSAYTGRLKLGTARAGSVKLVLDCNGATQV